MRINLKRSWEIFSALVRCNLYLLYRMFWKLQPLRLFQAWDRGGATMLIAAASGTLSEDNIRCVRVFFNKTGVQIPHGQELSFRNNPDHGFTYYKEG